MSAARIVSLLPSATEILFAVGAGDRVVGVTFECDFPAEARTRRVVSDTDIEPGLTPAEIDAWVHERLAAGADLYRLDEGALRDLDPDLIVTQDLCAVCAVNVEGVDAALDHLGCRADVVSLDPMSLEEVLGSIAAVGEAVGRPDHAAELVASLRARLDAVRAAVEGRPRPRVAVVEWTDPPFCAGHWLPDMVVAAGGDEVLGAAGAKSHQVTWADVASCRPDVVVVAPCGFRLDGAVDLARAVVDAGHVPSGAVVWAADADSSFVRPGPRLVDGVEALAAALHPGTLPERPDLLRCL